MVLGPTQHGGTLVGNCSDNPFLSGGKMYGLWRHGGGNYDGTLLKADLYPDQYVIRCERAGGTLAAPPLSGWTVTFPDATHATRRKASLRADGGTLYLDIKPAGLGISFR